MWIVVDCNVLVDASGQGMEEHAESSYALLEDLIQRKDFVLAIDSKAKIKRQYDARIAFPMHAHNWLGRLLPNRMTATAGQRVPRGVLVSLREVHFDQNDVALVEAAYNSDRIIVTRDFNSFTGPVQDILRRRLNLRVYSAVQMCRELALLDAANAGPQEHP